jgi:iron complex transport system substrate-binding protein
MSCRSALLGLALTAVVILPTTAGDTGFPRSVEHALGTTTIADEPQRIIALIDRDADTLLALGEQPVAIRSNYNFEAGVGVWAEHLLEDKPIVWGGRELNYEAIAAADPDLIVFATSGGDADEYNLLSRIAPTISLPKDALPWQATTAQTTRLIAEALGRKADGEKLLADLDAYMAAQKRAHPEFSGKTANYLDVHSSGIYQYADDHIVNGALYALGFKPIQGALDVADDAASIVVSPELLPDYDADIVLAYPFERSLDELITEIPTLATLPSIAENRFFLLDNLAFSNASVLSIPYALERLIPQFSAALAE